VQARLFSASVDVVIAGSVTAVIIAGADPPKAAHLPPQLSSRETTQRTQPTARLHQQLIKAGALDHKAPTGDQRHIWRIPLIIFRKGGE